MNKYLLFFLSIILISCSKTEGEGGNATINGVISVKLVSDDFNTLHAEFPAEDYEVFIVYGDDDHYGDKTTTMYDGTFQFNYLRKGNYKIYAFSDDESGQSESGNVPKMKEIVLNQNSSEITVDTIFVYDQVSSYEGSSTIHGKVFAYDYTSDLVFKDSFYLRNEWVHIARKNENYYFDRIRTYYDGSFVFTSLPIGKYEVYVYGRDISAQDPQDLIPYIREVEITENRQSIDVGRIDINN